MAYMQSRSRPNKPRSIMAACSTPGWKVVDGEILPDGPDDIGLSSSKDEPDEESELQLEHQDASSEDKSDEEPEPPLEHQDASSEDKPDEEPAPPLEHQDSSSEDESEEESELPLEHPDSRWTRPTPPLPAAVVFRIFEIVVRKKPNRGAFEEVVKLLRKSRCPADLINESLVHWLFSIMRLPCWNWIDLSLSRRLCGAQLEDRIEYILRSEQSRQMRGAFDIRKAANGTQSTLAAYIRRLCEREKVVQSARRFFMSKQMKLRWGDKEDNARGVYDHKANDARYKEPRSVSPEHEMLPSIETDSPERPGRRRPSRFCRTGSVSYVDSSV